MSLIKQPFIQLNMDDGLPYALAQAYFTLTGTTTPATVYSDSLLAHPISQPVVANDEGRFPAIFAPGGIVLRVRIVAADGDLTSPLIDVDPVNDDGVSQVISTVGTAGGTSNVITGVSSPPVGVVTDGMIVFVRFASAITARNPTYKLDGSTPELITKRGGASLEVGDVPNALFEGVLRYNLANTRWELLNPASVGAPRLHVAMSVRQALVQSTTAAVLFNDLIRDDASWYSAMNGRYTPKMAGWYFVCATLTAQNAGSTAAGAELIEAAIAMNGANLARAIIPAAAAKTTPSNTSVTLTVRCYCNGNTDYINATMYSDDNNPGVLGTSDLNFMQIAYEGP